jgi:cysteinyl-tRNA synthetase
LDQFRALTKGADAGQGAISQAVVEALADDLNTPLMIAELHKLSGEARVGDMQAACDLRATCRFLGIELDNVDVQEILKHRRGGIDERKVASLIDARNLARKTKDFKESDRIRDELKAMGVVLKDSKDGTTWEIAR